MTLTTEEFTARMRELILAESPQPARIWYLSFVNEDCWLGGMLIRAPGLTHAVMISHFLKINPGGELFGLEYFDHGELTDPDLCRLLTLDECKALLGPMKTIGEIERGGYYFHDKAGQA